MRDCERAAHAIAHAEVYSYGLRMVRESYYSMSAALDGFPGTEDELQRFLEAMRCVESTLYRFQQAALEFAEDCGESGAWEAEDDRIERQEGIGMSKAKRKKDRIENADRHLMEEYDRCIALLDEAWGSMHEIRGLKEIIRGSMDGMDVPFSQTHWNGMMSALMIELTGDRENWRRRLEGRR